MTISQIKLITQNRLSHEDYAPRLRWSALDAAVAEFTALQERVTHAEDRAAACTCREPEAFVIPTRRHNGPLDAQFTLARFKRMAAEEGRA
jgi:hypothetical protein